MLPIPPTNRLSPKNQVTLPRDAAGLAGIEHVRALASWMPAQDSAGKPSPVVLLMSEPELRRRERRIIEAADVKPERKQVLVQQLNAGAASLSIDEQRRIVLPAHQVEYLALQRDVLFVTTGDLVYVWNPDEFQRWSSAAAPADEPDLSRFILV